MSSRSINESDVTLGVYHALSNCRLALPAPSTQHLANVSVNLLWHHRCNRLTSNILQFEYLFNECVERRVHLKIYSFHFFIFRSLCWFMCFIFLSHTVLFEKQGENRNYCSERSKAVISSLPKRNFWMKCYLQDHSNCLFLLASKEQMVNSKLWIVVNPFHSQLKRSHAQSCFSLMAFPPHSIQTVRQDETVVITDKDNSHDNHLLTWSQKCQFGRCKTSNFQR